MAEQNQGFDLYQGDTKDLEVKVKDQDGEPLDLTGSSITWRLFKTRGTEILRKEVGSGIDLTDTVGGVFTIRLNSDETKTLKGKYQHEAFVRDVRGYTATIFTGIANVYESFK